MTGQRAERKVRKILDTTHRRGFTLVKLLVVVAIIVILLAMLSPSLVAVRRLTRRAVCGASGMPPGICSRCYESFE